jgi:hypothetical protein
MKASQFIKLLIPLFCTIACANKSHQGNANNNGTKDTTLVSGVIIVDSFETGKVIPHVVCKADAAQSYALYIPAKGNHEPLPVIYFFDPHGDGSLPLNKYKALADEYNFILIGSNNSKNGNDWTTSENIWSTLFGDSQKRVKINANRIYTCGFSGGAKVAAFVALNHNEVKGVIANGAGLPDATPAGNFHFSFTAIAGEGDMNMTELVAITNDLDKTQTRHRIIFFNGIHEWAPENTMNIAFEGLQLDAMYEKLMPQNLDLINKIVAGSKKRIADYLNTKNYIKAEEECKISINMLDGLTSELNWFKEKDGSLKNNPAYKKQWQSEQNLISTEQSIKARYMQQFEQGDMNYWGTTIKDVQAKAKAETAVGAMYKRLQAYLSLAFYSISNQLITANRNAEAEHFVSLYKMVDAANSEAWYFSAILNARNNNAKAAEADLMKAVEQGFADKNRLFQQPEFQQQGTQINLTEIANKMKN